MADCTAPGWRRFAVLAALVTLVTAVAASRLVLEEHTVWEVVAGTAIGLAGVVMFTRSRGGAGDGHDDGAGVAGLRFYWAALTALVIGRIALSFQPLPLEDLVQGSAVYLADAAAGLTVLH